MFANLCCKRTCNYGEIRWYKGDDPEVSYCHFYSRASQIYDCLEAEGDLRGALDSSGNVIISNTALRDNLPFDLKPLRGEGGHKQVCGCKTCHIIRACWRSLCQYFLKLLC